MSFLLQQLQANGGTGSPTTLGRVVASKAILDFITSDSISDIAVANGGSGYVVGETFDLVPIGSPGTAIFTTVGVVTSVDDTGSPIGVVTGVKIVSGGAYPNLVQSPEIALTGWTTTNASASGAGLTVDVTPEAAHWTQDRGDGASSPVAGTDYVDDRTDFEWLCSSLKASNAPTIGLTTAQDSGNGYFSMIVATGFDKTQTFGGQPGASPSTTPPLMMVSGADPQIYVSSTERRVNIVIRNDPGVQYGTLGLFIPFTNTEANYPFPGAVFGQGVSPVPFTTGRSSTLSGVVNAIPVGAGTPEDSPYWYRDNLSASWLNICYDTQLQTSLQSQMWPQNQLTNDYGFSFAPQVDGFGTDPVADSPATAHGILGDSGGVEKGWFDTPTGGSQGRQGVAPLGLGNRLTFVVQPHIISNQGGDVQLVGITDGYEACHGIGLTAFEEIVQFNGKRYIVFPDTSSASLFRWVAMEIV